MTIYADNAATTKMSRTAIDAMLPYFEHIYGNPSSLHTVGQNAAEALESFRETIAKEWGSGMPHPRRCSRKSGCSR